MSSRSTGRRKSAWVAILAAVWGAGCWGIPGAPQSSCATDPECASGFVCREAQCRKACAGGTWVGQQVQVDAYKEERPAVVASCDKGLWVKYESGIEEQVSASRIKAERKVQAR